MATNSTLKRGLYRGFSFFEYERTRSFVLTDADLIKMDLLNHIFTRRGEKVRQVRFGTGVPDLVFEQVSEETIEDLYDDLEEVFDFDPRVELLSLELNPQPDSNTITAAAKVRYVELDFVDTINLNILTDG